MTVMSYLVDLMTNSPEAINHDGSVESGMG